MQRELSNLWYLYNVLRTGSEQEAHEILTRIRASPQDTHTSHHIRELADLIRDGDQIITKQSHVPISTYPNESSHLMTLPPIRLALDSTDGVGFRNIPAQAGTSVDLDEHSIQPEKNASDTERSAR